MPEKWTGKLIGEMHNAGIKRKDIADYLGCNKSYISMILNGTRTPPDAKERLRDAFEAVKKAKEE